MGRPLECPPACKLSIRIIRTTNAGLLRERYDLCDVALRGTIWPPGGIWPPGALEPITPVMTVVCNIYVVLVILGTNNLSNGTHDALLLVIVGPETSFLP